MPHKKKADSTKRMFRDPSGQQDFIEKSYEEELEEKRNQPVECLGKKFPNDDARREHFLEELAKKLKDPEFRKIEGFPIGEDEDILALSDPPYYTACPNPWLADLVAEWEKTKPKRSKKDYAREPFAVDVSEGKTDALYKAHSYHTKVPHLAIVPSILHYTEPGDIVLDGFCGSGMTGVAAQWCGSAPESYRKELESSWKRDGRNAPKWGARHAVLNDLSPAASFIAANYNLPFDVREFTEAGRKLLDQLEDEIGWMYETTHTDGKTKARIDYTVWSEVYACPECTDEVVFLDVAYDPKTRRVHKEFSCPHCGAGLTKSRLQSVSEQEFDPLLQQSVNTPKRKPVFINYRIGKTKHEKRVDEADLELLERIARTPIPEGVPVTEYPFDDMWEAPRLLSRGITHVHQLFLPRALRSMAHLWNAALGCENLRLQHMLMYMVEQAVWGLSVLNRYGPLHFSQVNRFLSGAYYVASQHSECSPWYILEGKLKRLSSAFATPYAQSGFLVANVSTASNIGLADLSVDYVFTDPPFGDNFAYAELNFLVESWLGVRTDMQPEAVVDRSKKNRSAQKDLSDYQQLMENCFKEYRRVLKPAHWITVVFHNSSNAVWNAIQEGMLAAGFVVADVRVLDKQQRSFKQVTSIAVKQDLVISAYRPSDETEAQFEAKKGTEESAWDFVRAHLKQLPCFVARDHEVETLLERTGYMLFDRMVAFHVQRGATVPLSSAEFLGGLQARFPCRDQMFFLPDQISEYEKKRARYTDVVQFELFVQDEASAIAWLRQQLEQKPQTFSDLHPQFTKEIAGWQDHERALELLDLLQQNFLRYEGKGEVPSQIHAYLSTNWKSLRGKPKDDPDLISKAKDRWYVPDPRKAEDLEKVRDRALLREFWEYLPEGHRPQAKPDYQDELPGLADARSRIPTGRRMKIIRTEAVRTGFKYCWQNQDYKTIVAVAKRIPEDVLQEDAKLLMWYDQALTRLGEE